MDNWMNEYVSGWPEMIAKVINEGSEPIGDYLKMNGCTIKVIYIYRYT